jgi:hypothetical protein
LFVSARKHLDQDWELDQKPTTFVFHLWDTIDSLGGWKGLLALFLGICVFYGIVTYTIDKGRKRRQEARRRRADKQH